MLNPIECLTSRRIHLTDKLIKAGTKKAIKQPNHHLKNMKHMFESVGKLISKADISFKVDNFEAKKDKENNMQFSVIQENFKTNVNIKNTGAISIETNTKG